MLTRELLNQIAQSSEVGFILINDDETIMLWNEWLVARSDMKALDVQGNKLDAFNDIFDEIVFKSVRQALQKGMSSVLTATFHTSPFPLYQNKEDKALNRRSKQQVYVKAIRYDEQKRYCLIQVMDVTRTLLKEEALKESARNLRAIMIEAHDRELYLGTLIDNTMDGVVTIDQSGVISTFNPSASKLFNIQQVDAIGMNINSIIPEADVLIQNVLQKVVPNEKNVSVHETMELKLEKDDGEQMIVAMSLAKILIHDKVVYVGNIRDITQQKKAEENILFMAHHDSLTGLPNRVLFMDRLKNAFEFSLRNKQLGSVMFIDLDRFKRINDNLGHHVGDLLLKSVAARLKHCLRSTDTISRLSGDEFAIIQTEVLNIAGVEVTAQKIVKELSRPFVLEGETVYISSSVGISIFPFCDISMSMLVQQADIAMYFSKRKGRNQYNFYTYKMKSEDEGKQALEKDLRRALKEREFSLFYQPQISISDYRIIGAEGLIRWEHPERGIVSPADFIPLAEECGLIIQLGEWVIREACEQLNEWQSQGLEQLRVAVNLSTAQFQEKNLVSMIDSIMKELSIEPKYLEFEITESMLMEDTHDSTMQLRNLHDLGVMLSIDDFGTGYSSLSYLKKFPVQTIKIDRSFVMDVGTDKDDEAIVHAVTGLGHSMGLKVVGEGVETQQQLDYLRKLNCDYVQGYYFSKPLSANQVPDFVASFEQRHSDMAENSNKSTA